MYWRRRFAQHVREKRSSSEKFCEQLPEVPGLFRFGMLEERLNTSFVPAEKGQAVVAMMERRDGCFGLTALPMTRVWRV